MSQKSKTGRKRPTYLEDDSEDDELEEYLPSPPPSKRRRQTNTSKKKQSNITSFFSNNSNDNSNDNSTKKKSSLNTAATKSKTKSKTKNSSSSKSKTKTKSKNKSNCNDNKNENESKTAETTNYSSDVSSISSSNDEDEDEYGYNMNPKWSCNQIRGKINKMLNNGDIKITHWLRQVNVNSNSYNRFMKLKGKYNGTQNQTYWAAIKYFKKQDKIAAKKKAKLAKQPKSVQKELALKKRNEKKAKEKEWNNILLKIKNYEKKNAYIMDDSIPIYDDCNDVRKKIKQFLHKGIVSQSKFGKEIGNIQANSMNSFMKMGPLKLSGASNKTFYYGYHWFERLRLANGEKKSKKRLENEKNYPNGFERRHDNGMRWIPRDMVAVRKGDHIECFPRFRF